MDFYELKNKYFSLVRKKMINDYKMGNIDFMESEELLDHIIERIGVYQDHGKSDDESIASAFSDFHRKLLALRPLTLLRGYMAVNLSPLEKETADGNCILQS